MDSTSKEQSGQTVIVAGQRGLGPSEVSTEAGSDPPDLTVRSTSVTCTAVRAGGIRVGVCE